MAYQKLQVGKGLKVIPSNTVNIPNPDTHILSGVADFTVAGTLTDSGTDFKTTVQTGDIVYNTTAQKAYYVVTVDSSTQLSLNPSDAGGAADVYDIYREATNGCILFVGEAGNVALILTTPTSDKSKLVFKGIASGAFLPTQVVRVDAASTTATDIIALW
tara:strand:- start:5812 stop:6291 length:480 start_codon:yes stop_codon:yes gene_type:complete